MSNFPEQYQSDSYLFEWVNCQGCGKLCREIDGAIYDDERNVTFCSEDCKAEYIASRINEDENN